MAGWAAVQIVDLTTERKLAAQVQEATVRCLDTEREAVLYYLLACHAGRTLVFVNAGAHC
jgi:superfamily II DNA/RNA helicase